jgi:hypothetical protein
MKALVQKFGAEPGAIDLSRVLRVAGTINYKHGLWIVNLEQKRAMPFDLTQLGSAYMPGPESDRTSLRQTSQTVPSP